MGVCVALRVSDCLWPGGSRGVWGLRLIFRCIVFLLGDSFFGAVTLNYFILVRHGYVG